MQGGHRHGKGSIGAVANSSGNQQSLHLANIVSVGRRLWSGGLCAHVSVDARATSTKRKPLEQGGPCANARRYCSHIQDALESCSRLPGVCRNLPHGGLLPSSDGRRCHVRSGPRTDHVHRARFRRKQPCLSNLGPASRRRADCYQRWGQSALGQPAPVSKQRVGHQDKSSLRAR